MAIPLSYNVRSVLGRWPAALVAVVGIGGTVGVFVAMLAMASGFQATLVSSGSPENALVRRAGADSEMSSVVTLEQVRVIADAPGVARSGQGAALVSPEVVAIGAFPLVSSGTDANVQVRGISSLALDVRPSVRVREGRFLQPGLAEMVVGRNAATMYAGLTLGSTVDFGGRSWSVVGIFDAGGSAFDSEIWCDAVILNQTFRRPDNIFQSVTVRLTSAGMLQPFADALTADPRLTVQVERERAYYARQAQVVTTMIRVMGFLVALVMGIGAVFGALNTMYSAVAARTREVATLRAIGFSGGAVVVSFLLEALVIAGVGGVLGCLAVLPVNGYTTGTLNWQTFSHLAFAFRIAPAHLVAGLVFALMMGMMGGLPPALRAARLPVASALREL